MKHVFPDFHRACHYISNPQAKMSSPSPELLKFIDIECFCWSVMPAIKTPMINAGMVFTDRHVGGINYPKGGVGMIAEKLALGIEKLGEQCQNVIKWK